MKKLASSKHLDGISDLVVAAPIRQGFVPSFETVSYESRLKATLKTLHGLRVSAREYADLKPFADSVERIQSIRSFRLVILDQEPVHQLLLAVTFDRPWEPYIRLVWRPLGPLLDLIFCNCEGYALSVENSFERYAEWVRQHQLDSKFFYSANSATTADFEYLAAVERVQREEHDGAKAHRLAASLTIQDPDEVARQVRIGAPEKSDDMGLEALAAIYRLTDYYPPDQDGGNGEQLHRAAREILKGWDTAAVARFKRGRFAQQLGWYERQVPEPDVPGAAAPDANLIQAGILRSNEQLGHVPTHGCLLLMHAKDPAAARAFLRGLQVQSEAAGRGEDGIICTVAFTAAGLERFGVPRTVLDRFPREFLEGMEARAGHLGDVRAHHPRNWRLPQRNWPSPPCPGAPASSVELSELHFVIHLRVSAPDYHGQDLLTDADHPLMPRVKELASAEGVELLSVQSLRRASVDMSRNTDHFGFTDGISQPDVEAGPGASWSDRINPGEILCGHANDRGDGPQDPPDAYLTNGSFLVIRKLRQNVPGLRTFVEAEAARLKASGIDIEPDDILAKMVGRRRDGTPLVPGADGSNDFNYAADPDGTACPFQSHVRRANPRTHSGGRPPPRIARRGMSYGPAAGEGDGDSERGLVFMAYNASIAEQFEVIQRWISGGNSSGIGSNLSDPLLGVSRPGEKRTFRFHHDSNLVRVDLAAGEPFVQLEWGAYLFAPSLPALELIANEPEAVQPGSVAERGEAIIQALEALDDQSAFCQWRRYFEDLAARDPGSASDMAAIWAAIRERRGGVLRTPYGVLVGGIDAVMQVFCDEGACYTVDGYAERMKNIFGVIYIGLDAGEAYASQSPAPNGAISSVSPEVAFAVAYKAADRRLDAYLEASARAGRPELKFDLRSEYIEPALADVARYWFDVPDQPAPSPGAAPAQEGSYHVAVGGWSWAGGKPRLPGHFTAPSRCLFSPHPRPAVFNYAEEHGQALRQAFRSFVDDHRANPGRLQGPLSKQFFAAMDDDPDLLVRTLIGALMGFLPTTDGCLRGMFYDWLRRGELWRLQADLAASQEGDAYGKARSALYKPLIQALQKRPAPEMVWRRATKKHFIGDVEVRPRDVVVVGIVSAMHEKRARDHQDAYPVFGGDRRSEPQPTHACPGYSFALGTMLGMVSALLGKGAIRALPTPFFISLRSPDLQGGAKLSGLA